MRISIRINTVKYAKFATTYFYCIFKPEYALNKQLSHLIKYHYMSDKAQILQYYNKQSYPN